MLLTEEEAKKKECPNKPLVYTTPGNAGEPVPQWTGFDVCSGSLCMAWRWDDPETRLVHDPELEKDDPGNPYNVKPVPNNERHGHCGLAGRVVE